MSQHLIVQFLFYYLSSGRLLVSSAAVFWGERCVTSQKTAAEETSRLQEVKNKRKFQTSSSKSGHGHLQEVVAYKRFQI